MGEAEMGDQSKVHQDSGEAEEGEIVDSVEAIERPIEPANTHPLEHSWTFWFDNPNGKSKQATWGSSLRPVYTFNTVEDFWWYVHKRFFFCFLGCTTEFILLLCLGLALRSYLDHSTRMNLKTGVLS
jgi:hypothetical protein